ncbi:cupin domain-containing protein [Amaricoccus macauensis]|uniref:cupin domain-containing protein n=1 Tax=Amaricoccus macauensis TaxID=57001 RepID=UPI003C79BB88
MPKISMPPLEIESSQGFSDPADECGPYATAALGDLGGLSQFGVRIEMLPPGSASSIRHWHSAEDEFVYMLDGQLVLVEDTGESVMNEGSAAAFRAGVRNGHTLENRSRADATFLVAGWRDNSDICTYSGRDRLCIKPDGAPRFTRRDGTPIERNARAEPYDDPPPEGRGGVINVAAIPVRTGSDYPAPHADLMHQRSWLPLGQAGGLSQFGANLVTLQAGGLSSLRHWHSAEDEFVLVLDGLLLLIEDDGETMLQPGDASAHPAGLANAHHMRNVSSGEARFLVIGTRAMQDTCTYADVDLVCITEDGEGRYETRDGTPVPGN